MLWSLINFMPLLSLGGDNADYILLADNMGRGLFMHTETNGITETHAHFPPLYPAVLYILGTVFGHENIIAFKLFSVICYLMTIVILYFLFRKEKTGLMPLLFIAVVIAYVRYSSLILTESMFIMLTAGMMYCFSRRKQKPFLYASIILGILMSLTRTAGIVFFIPVILVLIYEKHYKNALTAAAGLAVSLLWPLRNMLSGGNNSYIEQLFYVNMYYPDMGHISVKDFIIRLWNNFRFYSFDALPAIFSAGYGGNALNAVLGTVLTTFFIYVFYRLIVKKRFFEAGLIAANTLIIMIWPDMFATERFILPVMPVMIFAVYAADIGALLKRIWGIMLIAGLAINLFIGIYTYSTALLPLQKQVKADFRSNVELYPLKYRPLLEIAVEADSFMEKDAVVIARKPALFELFSNRRTIIYPFTHNTDEQREFFGKYGVDYIIFDRGTEQFTSFYLDSFIDSEWYNITLLEQYTKAPYFVIRYWGN